jgi:hypothetical protein
MLLCCAEAGAYRPYWSSRIHAELERNLPSVGGVAPEKASRLVAVMQASFPAAIVPVWPEDRLSALTNDPGDRDVLGVAIEAGARFIVTENIKHFPDDALRPYGIRAVAADDFLYYLLTMRKQELLTALTRMSNVLTRPHLTPTEILMGLRTFAPRFSIAALAEFG